MQTLIQRLKALPVPGWVWYALVFILLTVLGLALDQFPKLLLGEMLIAGLFAMSLNLILGYGGMVHFGHAAFYGLGAYTVAVLSQKYGVPLILTMILAPFVSAAVAVVIGWFCVRRVRLYFAILTLAFGQLIYLLIFNARDVTGGDDGLQGLLRPDFLNTPNSWFVFTLIVFVICFFVLRLIVNSPFVLTLVAIRENPQRAQFLGVDVRRHQLVTFVIGAFFAGIAGMLIALHNQFVDANMLYWTSSSEPILSSLIGGMFSLSGPVFGAGILVFLHIAITQVTQYWPFVLGVLTVGIVLVAPTGVAGLAQRWTSGVKAKVES
ncbi:MAG TPA: branched-chain amino acid ABC transporter permease [Aggregatilineales bacterium]|nr:branched-chain amino acid ABC transporter permease [Aggregatilineales bacterium]